MKTSMDDEIRAYQLRKAEESRPSLGQWLIIIALGVFLGNLALFGVWKTVEYWEVQQAIKEMNIVTQKLSDDAAAQREVNKMKMEEQRRLQAIQEKQQQLQIQQRKDRLRQAKETCDFWNQQLAKQNTSQNRMHRDQACN